MSAIEIRPASSQAIAPASLIDQVRALEPRFFAVALLMLAAMAPTGFAAFADQREFLGINVWVKPLKFQPAVFVYFSTLAIFAMFLQQGTTSKRWYRIYAGAVAITAVLEIIWICGAAMLGTASHFNPTPLGDALYSLAGAGATLMISTTSVYAFQIARNSATGLSPAVKESLVIGLALTAPLTLITAGTMSQMGGHFIGGTPTDAGGLPLMGWSRDGGDLRVAHFFSTHAMHFVPAFGLLSAKLIGPSNRLAVRLFAAVFTAFAIFLFVQALMGEPFLPQSVDTTDSSLTFR
jgi:hypothetical protein